LEVIKRMPPDKLLVENRCTVSPAAAIRGKRNEPSYIVHTVNNNAAILSKTPEKQRK